jgi:CBS domain-containing protein
MQETVGAVVSGPGGDELITVSAGASVSEAVRVMAERQVGAVLILSEDGLVDGIFTERDLLVRVVNQGRDPAATPLSLVMTREVRFVTPGTTLEAALSLMHLQRLRHLLVIDGPRVHGLVSMRDLARQLVMRGAGRFEAALRAAQGSEGAAAGPGDGAAR